VQDRDQAGRGQQEDSEQHQRRHPAGAQGGLASPILQPPEHEGNGTPRELRLALSRLSKKS